MAEQEQQTTAPDDAPATGISEAEIRERVRDMTARVLGGNAPDAQAVEAIFRAVTSGATRPFEQQMAAARQQLADQLAGLDDRLQRAAGDVHAVLQGLGTRGAEFDDGALKEVFARLKELQEAYVALVGRVAAASSGSLQHELQGLAEHVQHVGVDVGAKAASVMQAFAQRMSQGSRESTAVGFEAMRDYGARMTMLGSGVLAGIADALQAQRNKPTGE